MWLFTKQGFISVVQHRDDPDLMRVRARVRADLERCFPRREAEIIEDRIADYRWHLNVPRAEVAEYLMFAIEDLDYVSHVKEEIALGLAPTSRMDAMYDIWTAMLRVQQSTLPPPVRFGAYGAGRIDWDMTPPTPPRSAIPGTMGRGGGRKKRGKRR